MLADCADCVWCASVRAIAQYSFAAASRRSITRSSLVAGKRPRFRSKATAIRPKRGKNVRSTAGARVQRRATSRGPSSLVILRGSTRISACTMPCAVLTNQCRALRAAGICALQRRAWHRTVGTKYATIARSRPQEHFAVLTLVKVLAGVDRHRLALNMPAKRARQNRFQNDRSHCLVLLGCIALDGARWCLQADAIGRFVRSKVQCTATTAHTIAGNAPRS